jgi:conjugal transfer pilin signal peptidase TrbI
MSQINLKHKLCIISIILIVFLFIHMITTKFGIGFNQSHSLSGRVFLIVKGTLPKKMFDKVVFKSFEEMEDIQKNGSKYPIAHKAKVKEVVGFGGDVVLVKRNVEDGHNHVYLNGNDYGIIKKHSLDGKEKLYPIVEVNNSLVIPQGYYFVWTHHKDSDDSRYSNTRLVNKTQIIGRAYEIL